MSYAKVRIILDSTKKEWEKAGKRVANNRLSLRIRGIGVASLSYGAIS